MSRLVYYISASLDGYAADADGNFDWGAPTEDLHAAINDDVRGVGAYLEGRRMYEMMTGWENDPSWAAGSAASAEFAELWTTAEKIVFSRTLAEPVTSRTRIERELSPGVIERLRDEIDGDLAIAGPTVACQALELGLVDVVALRLCPVMVGGGLSVFPDSRVDLVLRHERHWPNGHVQLTYDVRR